MGNICSRMDSIEHAENLVDIINIISSDKDLFIAQFEIMEKDTKLQSNIKEKKMKIFIFIIKKLEEYRKYLNTLVSLKQIDVYEIKIKYKHLMKEIDSQQHSFILTEFNQFDSFLYKDLYPTYKI